MIAFIVGVFSLSFFVAGADCPPPPWAKAQQPSFAQLFTTTTVRMDFRHFITDGVETIEPDGFFREGKWPGNPGRLLDQSMYGEHVFQMKTTEGKLIYSRSYSSLFAEWCTTDEAKRGKQRIFEESVRFPKPQEPVVLEIVARKRNGESRVVWTYEYRGRLDALSPEDPDAKVVNLHNGDADPASSLDIVIVTDGYTKAQAEKQDADLRRFAGVLLEAQPYAKHEDSIAIRAVTRFSPSSGPAEPRKKLKTSSLVATTFNTFDSARYLTVGNDRELRRLAAMVPYDTILVMVNTARYGGAGIFRSFAVFVSDNDFDEYVFLHEFGHSFAGLGDEYYTSSVAYSDFYPKGFEPWEPNITAMLDGRASVKWAAEIPEDVPVPTPEQSRYAGVTGVFEGAGYAAKGLYRPALDCLMFSKRLQDCCHVCSCAVEWMILEETGKENEGHGN